MQLVVGRIGRAHGVRGDLFVEVRTDEPELRFATGSSVFTSDGKTLTFESTKVHSGRLVAHFVGVDDRTAAEQLTNLDLIVDVDPTVTPEDPDEFYDHQLVGIDVRDVHGNVLGEVSEVVHLPAQDLLVMKRADKSEVFIPFVTQFVPEVNVAQNFVVITPPVGLLDEAEAEVVRDADAEV